MTLLKRFLILMVAVIAAVGTRAVVRYGVRGLFDRITNSADAQTDEDSSKSAALPKPVTSQISMGGPLGAGAKAAARSAVAKANAQLSEQTGQEVPVPAGSPPAIAQAPARPSAPAAAPAPAPTPAAAPTPAPAKTPPTQMVAQQGAPQSQPALRKDSVTKTVQPPVASKVASTAEPRFVPSQPTPVSGDTARSLVMRETFAYTRDARRDPFISLMTTSDLRPTMSDLRLTGILYDLSGRRPVAILRDLAGGQWRVTTGMTLGRMRVAQIKPKTVIFTIEEFGFSRNDSLVLGDTTKARPR